MIMVLAKKTGGGGGGGIGGKKEEGRNSTNLVISIQALFTHVIWSALLSGN